MYLNSNSGVTGELRELVDLVKRLNAARTDSDRITNSLLAQHLNLPVVTVARRAKRALTQGWLVNREQRKYYPADYAPGEPMPEAEGLPEVDRLTGVNTRLLTDFSFENGIVNRLTGHTAGGINTSREQVIPCIKGPGFCSLRTTSAASFSCRYMSDGCPFRLKGLSA
jgi:hypothetical protein